MIPKIKNNLNNIVKKGKCKTEKMFENNVVYKISCKNCNVTYVGETKRQLQIRISEHKNNINRISQTNNVITEHRINENHDFEWKNIEILDKEVILQKRLTSEMIHIYLQINSINIKEDTKKLYKPYLQLLH